MPLRREQDLTPPPQEVSARLEEADVMERAMLDYFAAEKGESALFVVAGLLAVTVSALLIRGQSEHRAMSYPLVAIGLVQIAIGGASYARVARQVGELTAELARDAAAFRDAEVPRMGKVIAGFRLYQVVELALLAAGVGLALAFHGRPALHALGIGLVAQSSVMLVLDLRARRRACRYAAALER